MLQATLPTIAPEILRSMELAQRGHDLLENRREEKEIDERRIELGSATAENDLGGGAGATTGAIPPGVGDRVVGIGDAHDPRFERNRGAAETAWIPGAIPGLVMAEDARSEIGIEPGQWLEHLGAPLRMGREPPPFARRELVVIVNHVVDGGMDLPDVVKERDALDAAAVAFVEVGGARKNQRVRGDATDVGAGLVIVGVDRVQKRLERRRGKSLCGAPGGGFTGGEERADRADGEAGNGTEHPIFFSHGSREAQEVGDTVRHVQRRRR